VPWKSSLSTNVLIAAIVIGTIAFCMNSLLGMVMRIKKREHYSYGAMSGLLTIIWGFLFISGMALFSPQVERNTNQQVSVVTPTPTPAKTSPTPKPAVANVQKANQIDCTGPDGIVF